MSSSAPNIKTADHAAARSLSYRPEVDGMRAIAVLAVLLYHVMPNVVSGGFVGVDIFFVISGFLITKIISKEAAHGDFNFLRFYARRAARLLPALYVVLLACVLLGWFYLMPSDLFLTTRAALGTVLFASNAVLWRDMKAGYFAPDASENPLLHTWSLGVEEQFYFVFPLLLVVVLRWKRTYLWAMLLAGMGVSLALAQLLLAEKSVAVFFLSPFRAWEFLVGAMLALSKSPRSRILSSSMTATIGLLMMVGSAVLFDAATPFPGLSAAIPVLGTTLLLGATGQQEHIINRILAFRPLVYIGVISYSLYLWHWPVLVYFKLFCGPELSAWESLVVILLSVGMASSSYHWIEKPFRTRAASIYPASVVRIGLVTGLFLVMAVSPAVMSHGAPGRFPPEVAKLDAIKELPLRFIECNAKPCLIGAGASPEYLFWGDSHMHSWVPAVDSILSNSARGGVLVFQGACPPVTSDALKPGNHCVSEWDRVNDQLKRYPSIHTVVLSARWLSYMEKPNRRFREQDMQPKQIAAIYASTARKIKDMGLRVVVIGPVPEYTRSIPMQLMQKISFGWDLDELNIKEQLEMEFVFAHQFTLPEFSGIEYVDPALTICPDECRVSDGSKVFYRDSNHLSAAGAEEFATDTFKFIK